MNNPKNSLPKSTIKFTNHIVDGIFVVLMLFLLLCSIYIKMDSDSVYQGADSKQWIQYKPEFPEEVESFDGVYGAYDLALHNYGPEDTVGSVHIEIDDYLTAKEIHALTFRVRSAVYQKFGIALTVGIYATNDSVEEFAEIRSYLESLLSEYPEVLQMHGFYVYDEKNIVSFDLIVDFNANREQIKEEVLKKLYDKYPEYQFIIVDDYDISD